MTTAEFRESREAMLDRQERSACLFVASCGVLVKVAIVALAALGLS